MRQLNKWQTIVFMLGGMGMVVGAGMFALQFAQQWACWIFLAGALAFASMQWLQRYEGTSITIRRLRRMQVLAGVFFIITGVLCLLLSLAGFIYLIASAISRRRRLTAPAAVSSAQGYYRADDDYDDGYQGGKKEKTPKNGKRYK